MAAILFFALWPTNIVVDDAGITLKYLDNFANGVFYAYNAADGPIYGLSSFLFGIWAGALAYSHIATPLNAAFAVNFVGFVLTCFFLLKILAHFTTNSWIIFAMWVAILFTAQPLIVNVKNGLETTLHIGILLGCFYTFYQNRQRFFWIMVTLALITKLDSLPIVAVLGMGFLFINWHMLVTPHGRKLLLQNGFIFCILPLGLWLLFCIFVFGSPLPQSAYAKLYYQIHPGGHWFPFLSELTKVRSSRIDIYLFLGSMVVFSVYGLVTRQWTLLVQVLSIGMACMGYFALYYYYNPLERHNWYYAIPELLMRLQTGVIVLVIAGKYLRRFAPFIVVPMCILFFMFNWPNVSFLVHGWLQGLEIIEAERMAVGRWVRDHSGPTDMLFAGHGHIARESGLYTVDYSGLNSKIVTDYGSDLNRLIHDLRPRWVVVHGLLEPGVQAHDGYQLRKAFYNIATYTTPSWHIFERVDDASTVVVSRAVTSDQILDAEAATMESNVVTVSGEEIVLPANIDEKNALMLAVGIVRAEEDMVVTAFLYNEQHQLVDTQILQVAGALIKYPVGRQTAAWEISILPAQKVAMIKIIAQTETEQQRIVFQIIDPVIVVAQ
ncbi:MAG: hypothetical protein R3A44_24535 [Caldilineaceae bacterium]